jgi:hypothetical protein
MVLKHDSRRTNSRHVILKDCFNSLIKDYHNYSQANVLPDGLTAWLPSWADDTTGLKKVVLEHIDTVRRIQPLAPFIMLEDGSLSPADLKKLNEKKLDTYRAASAMVACDLLEKVASFTQPMNDLESTMVNNLFSCIYAPLGYNDMDFNEHWHASMNQLCVLVCHSIAHS